MTWRVSAKPRAYQEALEWFRAKVPMTDAQYQALSASRRRKAFTVAGVAQLDLVHEVWTAIDAALEKGTTLDEFKRSIGDKLAREWGGKNGSRVETIFRTNMQSAYGAGRYAQMTDPDVLETRPYWMYDSILDGRTSGLCKNLNGTIKRHNDPWWDKRIPPLHHRCRSGIRTLTEEQAQARGITSNPPDLEPSEGFGYRPNLIEWTPKLSKYAEPLRLAHLGKMTNPNTYLGYYGDYGDAAVSLAWGKAMLEVGLDTPIDEIREALGFTPFAGLLRPLTGRHETLRDVLVDPNKSLLNKHRARVVAALHGHLKNIESRSAVQIDHNPNSIPIEYRSAATRRFDTALLNISLLLDKRVTVPADMELIWTDERSRTNGKVISMNYKAIGHGIEHEIMHILEAHNSNMKNQAFAFFSARTANESSVRLRDLYPDAGFTEDELALLDGFFAPYVGKIYDDEYTEINSMGVQFLLEDAIVFQQDLDHLFFILGQLAGR